MIPISPSPATAIGDAGRAGAAPPGRRVVDAPTRMFHALFALTFAGAMLTADSERTRLLHVTLGYAFGGLLAFRVLYGFVGPRPVRLASLWRRIAAAPAWLRALGSPGAGSVVHWRQGRHLAVAVGIAAMLALAVPLVLTGHGSTAGWGDSLEEPHALLGNTLLALAITHLALILLPRLVGRGNPVAPMLTGRAAGPGPDLIRDDRRWLAGMLLVAVLAFGAWYGSDASRGAPFAADAEHATAGGIRDGADAPPVPAQDAPAGGADGHEDEDED